MLKQLALVLALFTTHAYADITEERVYEGQTDWVRSELSRVHEIDATAGELYRAQVDLIDAMSVSNNLPPYSEMVLTIELQLGCQQLVDLGMIERYSELEKQSEITKFIIDMFGLKVDPNHAKLGANCADLTCAKCSKPRADYYDYLKLRVMINERAMVSATR